MALIAWGLAIAIAAIYSTNMTLMLRPEVWQEMYSRTAAGNHLPPHDPTLLPRWSFMVVGGLTGAGLWMIWLAGRPNIEVKVRTSMFSGYRVELKNIIPDCACAGEDDHMIIYITDKARTDEVRNYISSKTGINHAAFSVKHITEIPKNSSGKTIYSKLEI